MFEIDETPEVDFGFGDFRDTFITPSDQNGQEAVAQSETFENVLPKQDDTKSVKRRIALAEITLQNRSLPETDQSNAKSAEEEAVGSAAWAMQQRQLAEQVRSDAIRRAEEEYMKRLAEIDLALTDLTCQLCCDNPADTALAKCQHRVCASCLPRLGGKCPWDRLDVAAD